MEISEGPPRRSKGTYGPQVKSLVKVQGSQPKRPLSVTHTLNDLLLRNFPQSSWTWQAKHPSCVLLERTVPLCLPLNLPYYIEVLHLQAPLPPQARSPTKAETHLSSFFLEVWLRADPHREPQSREPQNQPIGFYSHLNSKTLAWNCV